MPEEDRHILSVVPCIIGGLILVVAGFVFPKFHPNIVFATVLFLSGFTGVIWVAQKEVPHGRGAPYTGITAVIMGSVWMLTCWVLAIFALLAK